MAHEKLAVLLRSLICEELSLHEKRIKGAIVAVKAFGEHFGYEWVDGPSYDRPLSDGTKTGMLVAKHGVPLVYASRQADGKTRDGKHSFIMVGGSDPYGGTHWVTPNDIWRAIEEDNDITDPILREKSPEHERSLEVVLQYAKKFGHEVWDPERNSAGEIVAVRIVGHNIPMPGGGVSDESMTLVELDYDGKLRKGWYDGSDPVVDSELVARAIRSGRDIFLEEWKEINASIEKSWKEREELGITDDEISLITRSAGQKMSKHGSN